MVYDFQGQEKRCIVVSTTLSERARARATPAVDARPPPLGLCDARRFNVALTRAQALCVVVRPPTNNNPQAASNRIRIEGCVQRGFFGNNQLF